MPFLIDGHNLIPKTGLQLEALDDEQELVTRLQEYCRLQRIQVEVYFDGAPAGSVSTRNMGAVRVHFVRHSSSADAAIEFRLTRLGKGAKNWTVVSSDQRVQQAARAVHARVLSAEDFSRRMTTARSRAGKNTGDGAELNPGEVDEWLKFFE